MELSKSKIRQLVFLMIAMEYLSLCAYFLPLFGKIAFVLIVLFALIASALDLKFGIYLAIAELLIGSKGYLFFYDIAGHRLSIRIALWATVIVVWAIKLAVSRWRSRDKVQPFGFAGYFKPVAGGAFSNSRFYPFFFALFIFILWGAVNGVLNRNGLSNIFFDANGWLYFAFAFPLYTAIKDKEDLKFVFNIFAAGVIWLSLKTIFLLFVFSHYNAISLVPLYRWIRETGVGEITRMSGGFSRIFFQSHIFVLAGLAWLLAGKEKSFFILTLLLSVLIISFSRSNWIGMAVVILLSFLYMAYTSGLRNLAAPAIRLIGAGALGIVLIFLVVKFPYPRSTGDFSASLLTDRASELTDEAGAESRWALLPKLWASASQNPILGKGYGATVSYKSSDPRVLEKSPDGSYSTYAFEWGFLDIWLKLGLFGILAYLILIGAMLSFAYSLAKTYDKTARFVSSNSQIIIRSIINFIMKYLDVSEELTTDNRDAQFAAAIAISLVSISAVSVFSPYLNHPLGIGFIVLSSLTLDRISWKR
jgi:hypothetical protein